MSKKWSKFLLALAGIGAAIGIGIAFFKKKATIHLTITVNFQMILKMRILIWTVT